MQLSGIKFTFGIALVAAVTCATAYAQQNSGAEDRKDDVLEVETTLVEVPIAVTDKAGKPVTGLSVKNFEVLEDGTAQEIASFSSTDAPFEVALLLDTSGSTRADLKLIVRAAEYFISSLRPGDRVAIIAYDQKVSGRRVEAFPEILSDLSQDRGGLSKSLTQIGTSSGTPFYDSLITIANDIFGGPARPEVAGRRALVALTDGVDSTSFWDFSRAQKKLVASGVAAYFINIDTREQFEENLLGDCSTATQFSEAQLKKYYSLFPDNARMEKVFDFCKIGDFSRLDISRRLYQVAEGEMNALANQSGGRVFSVSDIRGAAEAFHEVALEIGKKYSLGYYSSNERHDGTYRKITVKLKGVPTGASVRARDGYLAPGK